MALTTSAWKGSKRAPTPVEPGIKAESVDDSTYGKNGANIAMPAKRHTPKLIKLHDWRIILGLGASVKSAPLMPFDSEIDPRANTKKIASNGAKMAARSDGWYMTRPIVPVIAKTNSEKKMMKKYLLLTKFLAEIGEE